MQVILSADAYDGICDAHCSLHDAITAANQAGGAQHIRLAPSDYVFSRTSLPDANGFAGDEDDNLDGDFDVVGELTIQGSGEQHTPIISQAESRLFEVRPGARLSLLRLSLENGRSERNGSLAQRPGSMVPAAVPAAATTSAASHAHSTAQVMASWVLMSGRSLSRPLKNYLRWQYCVKNGLGRPPAANAL